LTRFEDASRERACSGDGVVGGDVLADEDDEDGVSWALEDEKRALG
jgi:hypothetical protein